MSAIAVRKGPGPVSTRAESAAGPVLPLGLARGAAYGALALFGGLHWMQMVEPAQPKRALWALCIGLAAAVLLLAARRLTGPLRLLAAIAVSAGALALALLAAGVADELLEPRGWGDLAAGLTRGVEAIPGARVPYRGLDQWTTTALVGGGTLLAIVAALLAFWPRHGTVGFRIPALTALVALYATPAVALVFDGEFRRGALLTLLLLAFLRLERTGVRDAPGASFLAAVTAILALMVAPALDREQPWWDYETWALTAASGRSTTFSWDHEYGPLDWPRDGRELLRVKARFSAYWKADSLDTFDGNRWRHDPSLDTTAYDPQLPDIQERLDQWSQEIEVTVRNLRSRTFVTAGVTIGPVEFPRRQAIPSGVSGIWNAPRALRRGDAYSAEVYTPRPSARELRRAGTSYERWLFLYRTIQLPDESSPPARTGRNAAVGQFARTKVIFPAFDHPVPPMADSLRFPGDQPHSAYPELQNGPVARVWELSQQLKRRTRTPYAYLRAVERYLADGFSYSETPPRASSTLDGFLFESKEGYCQQFSGAMALLLRMGGIPARVATGFTSGSQDPETKEYVVRDFDAHSWVEAWFPGWGWVVFDPTPTTAPPRLQADDSTLAGIGDVRDLGTGEELDPRAGGAAEDRSVPWPLVAAGLGLLLALGFLARPLARAIRRRGGHLTPLGELQRAMRRSGRRLGPGLTLAELEADLAAGAAGYVRAVRDERFGGRPTRPTREQRRALRSELGRGSLGSRVRSWWALPPRPPLRPRS